MKGAKKKSAEQREVETLAFTAVRRAMQMHLSLAPDLWRTLRMSTWIDHQARKLVLNFETVFLGDSPDPRGRNVPVMIPASWWQHLKQDLFPDWLLRRFPVQTSIQEVVQGFVYRVCPHHAVDYKRHNERHLSWLRGGIGKPAKPFIKEEAGS